MSVFAPSVSSLWRLIEHYGIDPAPMFKKHGIQAFTPFDPNARFSSTKLDQIFAEASEQSGDPFFCLKEPNYFLPSHIGSLGFAWLASTSLRSAVERLQRYIKVIHEKAHITIKEEPATLVVALHSSSTSVNYYARDAGALAYLVRMCRFIAGNEWHPVQVTLAHPAPMDTSYFFQLFRCPVEFAAEHNSIQIDRQQADKHLTGSNKQLAQLNDHMVVKYLANQSRDDIVSQVKTAILENLGDGGLSESVVSQSLHMSTRNLNRKLSLVNTNFKTLLLETRSELANQYINDASITLTEISYMLGFSEISSFSRAYKRWTGQSPSEARKSQLVKF
jgi:AraC-like DNA-binding protein